MYRTLTQPEIDRMERNGCQADDWKNITVKDGFDPGRCRNVQFSGTVKLGQFTKTVSVYESVSKASGIYDSLIQNCIIDDDACISGVRYLANYHVGAGAVIDNVATLMVTGESSFGNGTEIEVLNEAGGRELPIYDTLSAQVAYLLVTYRHDQAFTGKLASVIKKYTDDCKSATGSIGKNARIMNCSDIRNVRIGASARIEGAIRLEEGTVASTEADPAIVGTGVIAKKFIIQSGSKVDSGALLVNCFVGQGVQMGKQFSAENSAFFANCEGFHGEACSIFAGPYSVTHHKSTLLIAGMFSFYNAGSGTNQSNHMYKLGPVHQGILERGAKTGSFSYLLWPSRVGAFSAIVGKHYANFDSSDLPFSYITEEDGKSTLTPAMNLFTVGTRRDSIKWPNRDRRKDPVKYDLINFDLFSPYIVGKVLRGLTALHELYEKASREQEYIMYQGIHIKRLLLKTTAKYYEMLIDIFLGDKLLLQLKGLAENATADEIRKQLAEQSGTYDSDWVDAAGLLAPVKSLGTFISDIKSEKTKTVGQVNEALHRIYAAYDQNAWAWCAQLIRQRFGKLPQELSGDELAGIIEEWRKSSVKLNNMIMKDAEKEFGRKSQIGFGIDGDEETAEQDFSAVRGDFDSNKFVLDTIADSERINKTADRYLKILQN